MLRVPGIARGGRISSGKFGGDGFAEDDGTSLLQSHRDGGIVRRHKVRVDTRAGRSAEAGRVDNVLEAHRYTSERTDPVSLLHGLLATFGGCQSTVPVDSHPRLYRRLQGLKARQAGCGD